MRSQNLLLTGVIACTVVLSASNALADDAATIFGLPSGTVVTYDNASGAFPVVTAILSRQNAVSDAHVYPSTSLLAQDSTGSLDIYNIDEATLGYSPQVGHSIYVAGTYSPYHQIPEIGSITSIFQTGAGVSPGPSIYTIPDVNVATLPQNIAGYLLEVDNVTISGGGSFSSVFPSFAGGNVSYTITDGSGNNMTLYDWVTSYSACAALGGQAVPTGLVNITGFASVYPGTTPSPEIILLSVTPVPEPTTMALCGAGGLLLLAFRLRRKA